jgi:predicted lipid-binding transport protein (Tim44 family)
VSTHPDGDPGTDHGTDAAADPEQPVTEPVTEPAAEPAAEPRQVRLRRAPRYRAFGLTGLVAGAMLGWLVLALPDLGQASDGRSGVPYLVGGLGLIGLLTGLGFALLVERRRR